MPVLKLTEEEQSMLVLLPPEERDAVILSLIRGEQAEGMSEGAAAVYCGIRRRERARLLTNERGRRRNSRKRDSHRDFNRDFHRDNHALPPGPSPSPPFLPPSLPPPTPPSISPPYNPPTTSAQPPNMRPLFARAEDFDAFWKAYPKKVGKQAARKAFQRVKEPLESLLTAIERQKRSAQWLEDNGKYIPHPTTWLNQGRWEDELPEGGAYGENANTAAAGDGSFRGWRARSALDDAD